MVYAIKLQVPVRDLQLKAGMFADATFAVPPAGGELGGDAIAGPRGRAEPAQKSDVLPRKEFAS